MMDLLFLTIQFGFPCFTVWLIFRTWIDRIHPEKKPDPTGAELLEVLEIFKQQTKKEIDALSGRIAFREKPRLRE